MPTAALQRKAEVRALARLALDELGGATDGIGSAHRAISDRVFSGLRLGLGNSAKPVKIVHDAIADGLYSVVGDTARRAAQLAGQTADLTIEAPPSQTRRGALLLGILQGLRGDALAAESSILASPMTVRIDGKPVPVTETGLADAFPSATGRIVVFMHGLMETEFGWHLGGRRTYGERLVEDLDCTPVEIRFNSGRHISDNGVELSTLLSDLVEHWPVNVEQIALVGHSMGGLIERSACYRAQIDGEYWVSRVNHVVCLGSPHLGAPLEGLVHYGSAALALLPETRPFGNLLRRRSAGIRDLRAGSLVDEDWRGRDADSLRAAVCQEVPLLDGAMHCFVSACVTRNPRHPLGMVIGDGLVLVPSSRGRNRKRTIGFRKEDGIHLGPANHFTLLNDDRVYDKLREWLNTAPVSV
jgi:pimeloyl-ACP methyl ester carboxylesterase